MDIATERAAIPCLSPAAAAAAAVGAPYISEMTHLYNSVGVTFNSHILILYVKNLLTYSSNS